MKKRFGFTLAEVLITLGIIGVVAAMTIPTLIQNTNSVKFESQFKKSISTLSQAALMAQAQYDVDYSLATALGSGSTANCSTANIASGNVSVCGILNGTLAGYAHLGRYGSVKGADGATNYSYTKAEETFAPDANYEMLQLADGSIFAFNTQAANCALTPGSTISTAIASSTGLKKCMGFIDVNGVTAPNREVACATGTTTTLDPSTPCALGTSGATIGDVYPVVFHDGTVEPATNAARAVLSKGRKNSTTSSSS